MTRVRFLFGFALFWAFSASLPVVGAGSAALPFPFVNPWDDARPNVLDVSWLNDGPAGSHGFIVARNGHFVESRTGRHVRFFGTNLGLDGCFPAHEDAARIAAHLAKYGVNVVRLHHQDATWAHGDYNIWDETHYKDHRHLDPDKLERMDYLVAQLEKHGIYVDMCLHVSRKFQPEDGFPESVKQISYPFDKRVDEFDRQMIAVDQEYMRDLLTHVNPYTKLPYTRDPGLLNVEINNENSLVSYDSGVGGLAGLPSPYLGELQTLWNGWLRRRYDTTARLAAAWKTLDGRHGPNLYPWSPDPARWTLEVQPATAATLTRDGDALRCDIAKVDGTDWHIQLYRAGLSLLRNGKTYTLSFQARADRPRGMPVGATLDHPNWSSIGLSAGVSLTPAWQTFSFTFQPSGAEAGHNRLPSLVLGTQAGAVWLRGVVLKEGIGAYALPSAQTLEAGTVAVEPSGRGRSQADWVQFLADTENGYAQHMHHYLRQTLGVRQNIFCSQAGFGGLFGEYRERQSDYVDNHAYWDYSDNPSEPVFDRPMVPVLGTSDALTAGLAFTRLATLPFSVTEYNHSFPNEYRAECLPEYATFAAFQDWDAIFLFAQADYGQRGAMFGALDRISQGLDASADPAIVGFLPAAALIFRAGLVPSAPDAETLALPAQFPAGKRAAGLTVGDFWRAGGVTPSDAFARRLAVRIGGPAMGRAQKTTPIAVLRVETRDPRTADYVADAPAAKAVAGFVGGRTITMTGAAVTFGVLTHGYGALTLTAMDRRPLAHSARVLLALVTHTQNTGQQWNAAHTQLTNGGSGPILVDGAAATVSLATDGPRVVYALDEAGDRRGLVPNKYTHGRTIFEVSPGQKTIWYEIARQ